MQRSIQNGKWRGLSEWAPVENYNQPANAKFQSWKIRWIPMQNLNKISKLSNLTSDFFPVKEVTSQNPIFGHIYFSWTRSVQSFREIKDPFSLQNEKISVCYQWGFWTKIKKKDFTHIIIIITIFIQINFFPDFIKMDYNFWN